MAGRGASRPPWLTKDDYLDMAQVSLEHNYRAAVSTNAGEVRNALRVLQMATQHGRADASVFLMGLIGILPADNWELRAATVEALRYTRTETCVGLLVSELRRVKGSNSTRRYLAKILDVLGEFPASLIRHELAALAEEPTVSPKMRRKLFDVAWQARDG